MGLLGRQRRPWSVGTAFYPLRSSVPCMMQQTNSLHRRNRSPGSRQSSQLGSAFRGCRERLSASLYRDDAQNDVATAPAWRCLISAVPAELSPVNSQQMRDCRFSLGNRGILRIPPPLRRDSVDSLRTVIESSSLQPSRSSTKHRQPPDVFVFSLTSGIVVVGLHAAPAIAFDQSSSGNIIAKWARQHHPVHRCT